MTATGTLDEELHRRRERAVAHARRLLGPIADPAADPADPADPADDTRADPSSDPSSDPADLRQMISGLTEALEASAPGSARALIDEHETALARLRQRFETRFDALGRAQAAVAELREVTAPSAMLARAPAVLCDGSRFDRTILCLVRGGRMLAEAAHFAGAPGSARAAIEQLHATPPRLEHPLIETELLRRRRATIVLDADVSPRVDPRLVALMGTNSYAAAPIVVGPRVIGVVHCSRSAGEQLDVLDRDVLWEFTSGLAQAYESASLRRTLRGERDQMRQFLEWLGARSGELTDAQITLERSGRSPLTPPESLDGPLPPGGRDERTVFEGLLTKRELEVLRLVAEGSTNKAIADALVISAGTVKFHVNSILRKLHAANRAEAVSRYLRLLGMRTP